MSIAICEAIVIGTDDHHSSRASRPKLQVDWPEIQLTLLTAA